MTGTDEKKKLKDTASEEKNESPELFSRIKTMLINKDTYSGLPSASLLLLRKIDCFNILAFLLILFH